MGCFLRCFGFKDCSKRISLLFSRFFLRKKKEPLVPGNQYSSLLSSKEKAAPSKKEKEEIFEEKFYGDDCVYQEQRQEDAMVFSNLCPSAKLRKTYGAILDSHVGFCTALDQHYVASDACKKGNWDQQPDESSHPPKVPKTSTDSEEKSKSCQHEDHDDKSKKTLLLEKDKHPAPEKELESVTLDMSPQIENQMKLHIGDSPYPTPLNLVDEMQTPRTIYPPKSDIFWTGMQRAQFIFPITDFPKSTFGLKVAGGDNENVEKINGSPNVDRPARGAIGAPSCVSPKSCDINEISNSTTKYNEAILWED